MGNKISSKFDEFMEAVDIEAGDTVIVEGNGRAYRAVIVNTENPKTVNLVDDTGVSRKFDANTLKNEKTGEIINGVSNHALRLTDLEYEFTAGIELGDTVILDTTRGKVRAIFRSQSLKTQKGVFCGENGKIYHIGKYSLKGDTDNARIIAMAEVPLRINETGCK